MEDATAAKLAAELAAEACYFLQTKVATVELSESGPQKLVRCLLGLTAHNSYHDGTPMHVNLSQQAIAQMLGVSRENVTRLLSQFRRKGVLDWTDSAFVIQDRQTLIALADLPQTIAVPPASTEIITSAPKANPVEDDRMPD